MKERQRWQPEEDALLKDYVEQFGAKDWGKVSQRTGRALDRDAKSCMERWKNYLKPGIKKSPLTAEEKLLVVNLQEKYGNKWKKIAAEVPGRTAKRLGKWWEIHKGKERKEKERELGTAYGQVGVVNANYNELFRHIAEKMEQRQGDSHALSSAATPSFLSQASTGHHTSQELDGPLVETDQVLVKNKNVNFSKHSFFDPAMSRQHALPIVGPISGTFPTISLPDPVSSSVDAHEQRTMVTDTTSQSQSRCAVIRKSCSLTLSLPVGPELRSRQTVPLPQWMSMPPTSSTPRSPSGKSMDETDGNGARPRAENVGREVSVGLSLASSPDGYGDVRWSHSNEGSSVKSRTSHDEEAAFDRKSTCDLRQLPLERNTIVPADWDSTPKSQAKSAELLLQQHKDLYKQGTTLALQRSENLWRVKLLKHQLLEEKLLRVKQKSEEVNRQVRALWEEERNYLESLEREYNEKVDAIERKAEEDDAQRFRKWLERHKQVIQQQMHLLEDLLNGAKSS